MLIKFPSGSVGYEINHFMGFEDPKGHLLERPEIVRKMYDDGKCKPGQTADYSNEEVIQLIKETANAIDIKQDHIDDSRDNPYNWTSLHQYHLKRFLAKLNKIAS